MRVCIPAADDSGLDAPIHGHFGSAPWFVLADTESGDFDVIRNTDTGHHGTCSPLRQFESRGLDAIVCAGMGRRAVASLEGTGIQVYITGESTVTGALEAARDGGLRRLAEEDACRGHAHRC